MYRSIIAPSKYFQGKGLLTEMYEYTKHLGKNFAIVVDNMVYGIVKEKIEKAFDGTDGTFLFIIHEGESTYEEAVRIAALLKEEKSQIIVGIGGGKVIDTAKLAGELSGSVKTVIIPTSAASDAPCSANTVIYDDGGTFVRAYKTKENPSVVLVDTEIIALAPVRLLVAGMGDAFATYYEARASKRSAKPNLSGGLCTKAGFAIAELCKDILLEYGVQAKKDVEEKKWSEAVDCVSEANIYLSGVGFENNGVAVAHATYNGLTEVIASCPIMHGEGVAYGLLVQLALEYAEAGKWDVSEWDEVITFYKLVGLPVSLKELGITDFTEEIILKIAEAICTVSPNAHRMPFEVTSNKLFAALKKVEGESL